MSKLEVKPNTIAQLFSTEVANFTYAIPKYQREYAWTKNEWEQLFNDIVSNELGYFLGSIICIDSSSRARSYKIFEVVDGQQRITTLSILLLAIYEKLLQFNNINEYKGNQDLNDELSTIKKILVIRNNNDKFIPRLALQKQNHNNADYEFLLSDVSKLIPEKEKSKDFGKRKISKAFRFFHDEIQGYIEDCIDLDKIKEEKYPSDINNYIVYKKVIELKKKILQALVVSIDVDSVSDAYILFESLNKRGIEITSLDLIKNKLIQKSSEDKKDEEALSKWEKIVEYLGDNGATQERFFRHFYNAFKADLNNHYCPNQQSGAKYPLGLKATRAKFLDMYDKMISKDWTFVLDLLIKNAEIYGKLITNVVLNDEEKAISKSLDNLLHAQAAPSYVLLMYLFSKRKDLDLTFDDFNQIIQWVTIFFVRRSITDIPATKYLDQIFGSDIIESIQGLRGKDLLKQIKKILMEQTCPDNLFAEKIKGPLYEDNIDMTRFLLCFYEQSFETRETRKNLWDRSGNNGAYIWTIEHIFPKGKNIPQCWIDMIANGDKDLAKSYLDSHAHTIGNLTLSGYNPDLGNDDFITKRDKKDKSNNYVGYRNGLSLNADVVSQDTWTIKKIEKRTEKLTNWFIDKFSY